MLESSRRKGEQQAPPQSKVFARTMLYVLWVWLFMFAMQDRRA